MDLQPASHDIYLQKYALRDKDDNLIDTDIDATFDRVALALAEQEQDKGRWRREFRDALEYSTPAGRIMSNAGATEHKSYTSTINCTVSGTIDDSMDSILTKLHEAGMTLKAGCGIGYCFSTLRPNGAYVHGAGASTSGPLSFMDIYDRMCKTIASAGGRRGAQMGTMHIWHPDVIEFIRAKREAGRLRQFNLSVLITDDFIRAVKNEDLWHFKWNGEDYGDPIPAHDLWDIIMQSNYNFAEPGFILVDRYNRMNNLWFCEEILATNPCGEQGLPPYGSCLLGSLNLTKFVRDPFTDRASFDVEKYRRLIRVFTRMLDNVVEIANLPLVRQTEEIHSKRRHGMGYMGLGSTMTMMGIPYGSDRAVEFTEMVTRYLAFEGFSTGVELAKEKGEAPILQQEFELTPRNLKYNTNARGMSGVSDGTKHKGRDLWLMSHYFDAWQEHSMGREILKDASEHGCRFSHATSIAPTGTIALSFGDNCSNGIEPSFAHHYVRNVIRPGKMAKEDVHVYSHEFRLYKKLMGYADADDDENIANLPSYFTTTANLTPKQHVDIQAAAQRWIDSSISKTCNVPSDISYKDFCDVYLYAHEMGLKGCTTFRYNPEAFQGVIVKKEDLAATKYCFELEDGSTVELTGDTKVEYEGDVFTAANIADAIREGTYGRM